jgi:hypothetical protein
MMARAKKRKTNRKKVSGKKKSGGNCLVLSPFGSWFDEYYELLFTPAIKDAGLEPIRADDLYKTGSIVNDIWDLTKDARILLADLSGKNPNVFYELGLAHAIAKPVVLITDNIDDVPFDLRSLRVIPYNKHLSDWGNQLKRAISAAIKETLAHPGTSILATFLNTQQAAQSSKVSPERKAILEMRQEIESLRNQMSSISRPRPDISSVEIRARLQEYRALGMSREIAVDRVAASGTPSGYIRHVADQIWSRKRGRLK